jgi:hypothetical protein
MVRLDFLYLLIDMAQVQTFPFSNLVNPVDNRPSRLVAVSGPSNISSESAIPEIKTKTYNGQLYQESIQTPRNPYYGPDLVIGLETTSSVNAVGDPLTLTVVVAGNPLNEFTYQWYRNNVVFNGNSTRTISQSPSGSTLQFSDVDETDEHCTYALRITNPYNDPPGTGAYLEVSTFVDVIPTIYHPSVLFTVVGAIQ